MSQLSASTLLEVLHAARSHRAGPSSWADDVRDLLLRRVPGVRAFESSTYDASDGSLRLHGSPLARGRAERTTTLGHAGLDAAARRAIYEADTFVRSTRVFFGDAVPEPLSSIMANEGIGDIIGIAQPTADHRFASALTVHLDEGIAMDAREAGRWATLIRHLGALAEVRDSALDEADGTSIPSPDGASAALDRACARAVHGGEEAARDAMDLWTRLLDEGFTVVEHASSGGRRRVVAMRVDDERSAALRRLSPAERDVVARAVRGLSNKEIAYELGMSAATVEGRLRRAQHRLGIRSRVELVRLAHLLGATR
jgi:DNA-binding CsgD family transcriptional regulator